MTPGPFTASDVAVEEDMLVLKNTIHHQPYTEVGLVGTTADVTTERATQLFHRSWVTPWSKCRYHVDRSGADAKPGLVSS